MSVEDPGSWWLILILLILVCGSAFFSASETALTSLNKIKLRNMTEENVKNADKVQKLIDDPNRLLSSILIGNNLVNNAAAALTTMIAVSLLGGQSGVGAATMVITIIILIFGEITPKTLASQNAEKVSLVVANIISVIVFISTPVVKVMNLITNVLIKILGGNSTEKTPTITEAELKTMVNVSHEEGVLEVDERRMINNVFDFGDLKAKDVMTPRTDMVCVEDTITYDEIVSIFKEERFSRLPVYHESVDNIVGILYVKDIIFIDEKHFKITDYMREPFFTYESKPISELFSEMRGNRIRAAVILDEYGGTSGLVTLEDLVEEIVGDIADEYDEQEEEIEVIKEDEFIVDGSTRLEDVNEMIGLHLESEDFDTIGGYVIGILGSFPDGGEEVETDNIKIVVEEVDKNRIEKLRIYTI
ncbi:hemolysin family protein [Clostridium sp. MD294]|uniref:CNNM domain-containing protein n=1 Tax=Clostridium sp. MD294 TaxID=97138 RepID=UPI0012EA83C7|nr:HlyC/CorC family transporter [Clostridium sp. MD294]